MPRAWAWRRGEASWRGVVAGCGVGVAMGSFQVSDARGAARPWPAGRAAPRAAATARLTPPAPPHRRTARRADTQH